MKARQRDLGVAGILLGSLALAACTAQGTVAPPTPTPVAPIAYRPPSDPCRKRISGQRLSGA